MSSSADRSAVSTQSANALYEGKKQKCRFESKLIMLQVEVFATLS